MELINKLESNLKKIFNGNQKNAVSLVLIIGCIGILLILLSEFIPEKALDYEKDDVSGIYKNTDFEKELESRLENEISKIKGAGKTSVMLTVDSSREYSYAKNSSGEKDERQISEEEEIVIIDGKNGEEPVIYKINEAKIRGVLVICEGGDNAFVREKIIEAVCALLDIPSNKVSVAKMA